MIIVYIDDIIINGDDNEKNEQNQTDDCQRV